MDTFEKMMLIIGRQLSTGATRTLPRRGLARGTACEARSAPMGAAGVDGCLVDGSWRAGHARSLDHVVVLGEN